jgi:hypothetical protein
MPIVSGDAAHMVERPGQTGNLLFEAGANKMNNG